VCVFFLSYNNNTLILNIFLKTPTIVLEAVASYNLWIWHAYFGLPGSHNDINVLDQSPIFWNIVNGVAPKCEYTINSNTYTQGLLGGWDLPWFFNYSEDDLCTSRTW
jgi:hypothetical protein